MRPAHSEQSSGIIETYEPWMHRAKGMPESPLKVLSRFLYHQRWVFTLHPKGLGSTATPNTVSKILRHLTKYVCLDGEISTRRFNSKPVPSSKFSFETLTIQYMQGFFLNKGCVPVPRFSYARTKM